MIIFLDFDGVIVDSIEECYIVSCETYYGYAKFPYDKNIYKKLFYKYRGLVKPASQYYWLHKALESYTLDPAEEVDLLFDKYIANRNNDEADLFEKGFFFARLMHQENDYLKWIKMNPLTDFGKSLGGGVNNNIYIVTTKNRQATESILKHYNISVAGVYANDDVKLAGNKGNLISSIMNKMNVIKSVFVDDAVEHLDTVTDKMVECYFADWGYGENNGYKVLNQSDWNRYL